MSIFNKLFSRKTRDDPSRNLGSRLSFFFGPTSSGKAVNETTAMQTTTVYSCVRILAESVASLPLHLYKNTNGGGKEKNTKHPLYRILHDEANPDMTSFIFRETMMHHLLLYGNAFAQIIRNGKNEVLGIYPLLPNKMEVTKNKKGEIIYEYTIEGDVYKKESKAILTKEEILHIPGLGFDGLIGYSPIAMAKNAIGIAIATEEYGASFFSNGATPGGILEHPGVVKNPDRLRESWHAQFSGKNNHKVAVLEEGMKFHQLSIPPDQAQFLETRKFQITEIARIFRIPPHMIGDLEKSSFNNIEQQSLEFVKYTLTPWLVRWEQAINHSLLLPNEKDTNFAKFSVGGLLRGDYESRMKGYALARQNGWLSANDIRELEDLNRISKEEGGDDYLINGNMLKIKDAGQFYMRRDNE